MRGRLLPRAIASSMAVATACATTPASLRAMAPGDDPPALAPVADRRVGLQEARRFEAALPDRASARELARLGAMWDRAGEPQRADAAYRRARARLREVGAALRPTVVDQTRIDHAYWVGDAIAVLRRVEALGSSSVPAQRLELWALDDSRAPHWVEYIDGEALWLPEGEWRPAADRTGMLVRRTEGGVELLAKNEVPERFAIEGTTWSRSIAYEFGGSGCEISLERSPTFATDVALSADERFLAVLGSDDDIRVFDRSRASMVRIRTDTIVADTNTDVLAMSFVDPAALQVAYASGDLALWRPEDGAEMKRVPGRCDRHESRTLVRVRPFEDPASCGRAERATFSADGTLVVTAGSAVRLREASTGASLLYEPRFDRFDVVALDADGRLFVAPADGDEAAAWWSAATGWTPMFSTPPPAPSAHARMYAGRLDIRAHGRRTRWDLHRRTAEIVHTRHGDSGDPHWHVMPGGRAVVEESDGRLHISRTDRSHRPLATVYALPSGGWIATSPGGGVDGTIDALDHLVVVVEGDGPGYVLPPRVVFGEILVVGLLSAALAGREARGGWAGRGQSQDERG